uniref:Glycosyl hydrolase family 38 C-terminal domain-containing protein n=1 Tax=Panagrolaimus sp. JU765 TaxID=591449 RepID=A0AC34RFS1_9BILA
SIKVIQGKYVQEVRQVINPWVSQVVRLLANQSFVEFDWIVGPILKEQKNPIGREIITRYMTTIKNDGVFYTDSNGRQMIQRKNDAAFYTFETTEPVSANYFPVPTRIQIADKSARMTILTDRSQGGASLVDGQVELMLHRRMYDDDHWGVEEALDEPGNDGKGLVVRGKHWLILEPAASSQKDQRKLALEMFHQPIVTFSLFQPGSKNSILTDFSGLLKQLPENIHVLTLKRLSESSVLLRLEHFLQNGDDT